MSVPKLRALPAFVTVLVLFLPAATLIPGAGADGPGLTVDEVHVTVEISNHYALTKVRTVINNTGDTAQPFTLRLASSDLAFITRFAIEVDGAVHEAHLENATDARDEYDSAVGAGQSAGLIESRDANLLLLTLNIPAGRTLTAHLEYEEMVYRALGEYRYIFPLASATGGTQVELLHIEGTVSGRAAVSDQKISNGSIETPATTSFAFDFEAGMRAHASDFWVSWKEVAPAGAGSFLTHTENGTTYFVHVFSPDGAGYSATPLPKDIVFVIDHSGSMSGTKMTQAKDALRAILLQLRPTDRFSIVQFDSSMDKWSSTLVDASSSNVENARQWVAGITSRGGTNIDGGLQSGVALFESTGGRAPVIVFLTDGQATEGVTGSEAIRSNLVARNTVRAAVFTLAFGAAADFTLLEQIAAENNGQAKRIYEGQDAASQIQGFYDTFGTPALTGVKVEYTADVAAASPTNFAAAYAGSDLVVVGQLVEGADRVEGTVSGVSGAGSVSIPMAFDVEGTQAGAFVERAWAYERIRQLERAALIGDLNAKSEIVDLAMRYHFVTEYTSLVVTVPLEYQVVQPTAGHPYLSPSRSSSGNYYSGGSALAGDSVPAVGAGAIFGALGVAALIGLAVRRAKK